jgi:hypothetical protein
LLVAVQFHQVSTLYVFMLYYIGIPLLEQQGAGGRKHSSKNGSKCGKRSSAGFLAIVSFVLVASVAKEAIFATIINTLIAIVAKEVVLATVDTVVISTIFSTTASIHTAVATRSASVSCESVFKEALGQSQEAGTALIGWREAYVVAFVCFSKDEVAEFVTRCSL